MTHDMTYIPNQKGFSLVELMIVVAIIGVIAAIAAPIYNGYISSARHSKAQAMLMQLPILMEQYRAESLAGNLCPAAPCNGNIYTEKTGTTGISATYLKSFAPVLTVDNIDYEYRISFTSDDEAELKAIVTGNASDNVTCIFSTGECN